jgi:signal transduction histidine kinase/response regulator of citrate/malate metabolism
MKRILIVDDKEENIYYLQVLLTGHGFLVDAARHGAEALVRARQIRPDAVISDLLMPVMDGYTLLRHWKADTRLNQVPFIVYTATYTEPEDERLAFNLGADAFILKPMEPEDFLDRLRMVRLAAPAPPPAPGSSEKVVLEAYSRTLIRKLEEKSMQLEEANRSLRLDIEERKRAEEELRWKTAFLEAQVDSALDGILVVDHQGQRILQNERMIKLWKFPPEVDERQPGFDLLQAAARQAKNPGEFTEKVAFLMARPDEAGRDEIELVDGTILDRYSSPVRDKTGKYYGRIWTFRDITERRNLEAQYRQAQKMEAIGQLAGGVAHDFNNVLAVVQLQTALLKMTGTTPEQQHDVIREIETAVQHAVNLTRQLLLFSRKQVLQLRDLNLNDIVAHLARMLQRMVGEEVRVRLECAPEPLLIHADAGMVDQILMNLAVNARDAMPQGGELNITIAARQFDDVTAAQTPLARPGSFACLSVSDTGCGIPPEVLPRIFEPFFTTKDAGKGTGLGLATVFGIVQQHQGWINVESQPGQGTTLHIFLPQLDQSPGLKRTPPAPTVMPRGAETLLLVEDDSLLRAAIKTSLSQLGYRVLEAANGVGGREMWQQNRPEIRLLLTDLVMPDGVNGKVLAAELLREDPGLKVIFISGYNADIIGEDVPMQEGVNFLAKPFAPHQLAQMVRDNLDKL